MKEDSPKTKIQKDKALQVHKLILTNPDMTQAKACAKIGIDPKTYRKWIALQPEALEVFEQTRIENDRVEFAEYLLRKYAITERFILDALGSDVSIPERIKALEYIDDRLRELSSQYHTVDIEVEQDLLSGPKQELGSSSPRM